jgi:hypothetical protein
MAASSASDACARAVSAGATSNIRSSRASFQPGHRSSPSAAASWARAVSTPARARASVRAAPASPDSAVTTSMRVRSPVSWKARVCSSWVRKVATDSSATATCSSAATAAKKATFAASTTSRSLVVTPSSAEVAAARAPR